MFLKKLYLFLSLFFSISLYSYIDRDKALVQVLDKVSGKSSTIMLEKNKPSKYYKLSFNLKSCKESDPFDPLNYYAFVEIYNNKTKLYSNWLDKNEPGINPFQNADFDVWLISCK